MGTQGYVWKHFITRVPYTDGYGVHYFYLPIVLITPDERDYHCCVLMNQTEAHFLNLIMEFTLIYFFSPIIK